MKAFLTKFASRKFLACIAGVAIGVCMVFGIDEGVVNTIAGAVTSIISLVVYIYTEGKIDAEAVDKAKDTVSDVTEALGAIEKIEE